jgi:UDP-N-acetyl-D-mannosaminuronate dehydrogenase
MITCSGASSLLSELKPRVETRQARIGVIGLGYVGLPLALLYTEAKFRVTGFDIDQNKVATLTSGGSYIHRIPPTDLQMKCVPVDDVCKYDCVLIVTDHSDYDYAWIAQHASLVVDTHNAMRGIHGANIVRC